MPELLLTSTLADFLPSYDFAIPEPSFALREPFTMPFAHHLVYFPPMVPTSLILPDGTDALHSPGDPFTRRMWAGGAVNAQSGNILVRGDKPACCSERIRDVRINGQEGEEKVLVQIERRFRNIKPECVHVSSVNNQSVFNENIHELHSSSLFEIRDLVFMRERCQESLTEKARAPGTHFKPLRSPDIFHTLTPTAALLFRFSALTFNGHSIHLDRHYCREVEGYRNLLVHGPLSLILMTEFLQRHLCYTGLIANVKEQYWEKINHVQYRNLAPLYVDEEMKICGRRRKRHEWEMWIEGKDRRLAVRGIFNTATEGMENCITPGDNTKCPRNRFAPSS